MIPPSVPSPNWSWCVIILSSFFNRPTDTTFENTVWMVTNQTILSNDGESCAHRSPPTVPLWLPIHQQIHNVFQVMVTHYNLEFVVDCKSTLTHALQTNARCIKFYQQLSCQITWWQQHQHEQEINKQGLETVCKSVVWLKSQASYYRLFLLYTFIFCWMSI